jgi:RimJ/RimL family protein N-acetyltransferase
MQPSSPRLRYARLDEASVGTFHALATDPHIRRYLLDGAVVPRAWAEEEQRASDRLFAAYGVGLWLVREAGEPIGFAGFRVFPENGPAPELLYALREPSSGRGLATEMCRAMILVGEAAGLDPLVASVDAVNAASVRILERCGFTRARTTAGAFGDLFMLERRRPRRA